jgi:5-oxopent-3-ene-1,2,5-tricarboxylate decarboxylase/2-hydroxyhepta-2,4-diene-1,7-dioate isomerase
MFRRMTNALDGPRREIRRIFDDGVPQWVSVSDDGSELLLGDGRRVAEAAATYMAPCDPTKILCIHLNYDSRRVEFRAKPLTTPTYFQKPLSTLNAHRGTVYRPADSKYLNYEGEIAVVVAAPMRNVKPCDVWEYVAGFMPSNDVGLHDFRDTDAGSMLRVKGQDGYCPVGPGLVSGIDIRQQTLRTYVNGEVVQEDPVSNMTFPIDYILADLCRHITLLPGDIILTGTPANSRPMNIGDVVEVEVTGVGRLTNTIAESPAPHNLVGHLPGESEEVVRVARGGDWWAQRDAERAVSAAAGGH